MGKLGRPRKRRSRTQHTGVKLFTRKRKRGVAWYARWIDPETRRTTEVSLDGLGLRNDESRRDWCIAKSRSVHERRAALAAGSPIRTRTSVVKAIEGYYAGLAAEGKRPGTLRTYKDGTVPFGRWSESSGLQFVEDLTGAKLESFRKWFVALRAKQPARGTGSGQGTKVQGTRPRSPHYINKGLRAVRTMLNQWRREGILPELDSDAIKDHLRGVRAPLEEPRYLRTFQLQTLLEAALRHDAETWKETRREHAGVVPRGTTPRYAPIFPFIVACLLTGCRYSEVAALSWNEVDLRLGEIHFTACRTKTSRARRVAMDVTPGLWQLLTELKLKSGGQPYVFGADRRRTRNDTESARRRLVKVYGAPRFNWQDLRRTCGTFLACAPGVYAAAGVFHAAKRLGHSVMVSERHYAGAITDVPAEAKTLEEAMGIAGFLPTVSNSARKEPAIVIQLNANVAESG